MIRDYTSLQTSVSAWLNKATDPALVARIPEFIDLAEAGFRRRVDDLSQEALVNLTITNGVAVLPDDFDGLIDISGSFTDDPINYNIVAGQIQTDPPETGTLQVSYKQMLPSLSITVPTNWLLASSPDIYLYGTLLQAEFFGWNDERLPIIKMAHDEALEELRLNSEQRRWGKAPLSSAIVRP